MLPGEKIEGGGEKDKILLRCFKSPFIGYKPDRLAIYTIYIVYSCLGTLLRFKKLTSPFYKTADHEQHLGGETTLTQPRP